MPGTLSFLASKRTMKRSCADDTGRCGTPGCNLTDRHPRLCTGTFVDGPRRNGTGFFQGIRAAGAARDAARVPAAAPAVADENGNGDGSGSRVVWTPVVGALIDARAWASTLLRVDQKSWCAMKPRLHLPLPASPRAESSSHSHRPYMAAAHCRVFNTGPLVPSLPVARTAPVT